MKSNQRETGRPLFQSMLSIATDFESTCPAAMSWLEGDRLRMALLLPPSTTRSTWGNIQSTFRELYNPFTKLYRSVDIEQAGSISTGATIQPVLSQQASTVHPMQSGRRCPLE